MKKIFWLTGNSGAGKTTVSKLVQKHMPNCIILDGDEMRRTISTEEGFSPEDRRRHNLRVARLADLLASQGFVVLVAVIAPFTTVREELGAICDPHWIYIKRSGLEHENKPYEPPASPHLVLDHDAMDAFNSSAKLYDFISQKLL